MRNKNQSKLCVGYTLGSWRSPIPVHRKESKRAAFWSCCLLHTAYCILRTAVSENKRKRFKRSIAITRGGVEDTRLEAKAKAKDTKKIRGQGQGQGQPFRGQTLSRPRTGMLEAKAKDQGHKAQVLSKKKKKKGLHKNFSGDLQKKKKKKKKKKGLHKNFSSDLQEKMLSKKFFNRSTKS